MTSTHWSTADIPDQTGRTAVVTGANTGLGYETALTLAAKGANVVVAVRNLEKGRDAVRRIEQVTGADVELQRLDLSSLRSVRDATDELRTAHDRIDLLINNAGVMFPPQSRTAEGFELQFGTNHLGHFALTGLLLDRMRTVPGSRVVTVSSDAQSVGRMQFDDLNWARRRYRRMGAYAQSKLANLLFAYELNRRLAGTSTTALAAHPGASNTELSRNTPLSLRPMIVFFTLIAQSAAMGALPTLRAATDPAAQGGQYYGPGGFGEWRGYPKAVTSGSRSHDRAAQQRLWAVSEALTGVTYPL